MHFHTSDRWAEARNCSSREWFCNRWFERQLKCRHKQIGCSMNSRQAQEASHRLHSWTAIVCKLPTMQAWPSPITWLELLNYRQRDAVILKPNDLILWSVLFVGCTQCMSMIPWDFGLRKLHVIWCRWLCYPKPKVHVITKWGVRLVWWLLVVNNAQVALNNSL